MISVSYCLQATTFTFLSQLCNASSLLRISPWFASGSLQTVNPNPLCFKLVTIGPSVNLLTEIPSFSNSAIASSANLARTSSEVLPELLTRSMTSLSRELENGIKPRSVSDVSTRSLIISLVRASGLGTGVIWRRPGSPWQPNPSSIVAGGRVWISVMMPWGSATLPCISTSQIMICRHTYRSNATAMVPEFATIYSSTSPTLSRVSPCSASAHTIFNPRTCPLRPLLPTFPPFFLPTATSSPTGRNLTLYPAAVALVIARPALSISPV
jgi:hypothetical protein